jgi:hypothetical protein
LASQMTTARKLSQGGAKEKTRKVVGGLLVCNKGTDRICDEQLHTPEKMAASNMWREKIDMVQITCDVCKAKKDLDAIPSGNDPWILGFDLEIETKNSFRRALTFLNRWDDRRVLDLGSIHLCREECRQTYIRESKAA